MSRSLAINGHVTLVILWNSDSRAESRVGIEQLPCTAGGSGAYEQIDETIA